MAPQRVRIRLGGRAAVHGQRRIERAEHIDLGGAAARRELLEEQRHGHGRKRGRRRDARPQRLLEHVRRDVVRIVGRRAEGDGEVAKEDVEERLGLHLVHLPLEQQHARDAEQHEQVARVLFAADELRIARDKAAARRPLGGVCAVGRPAHREQCRAVARDERVEQTDRRVPQRLRVVAQLEGAKQRTAHHARVLPAKVVAAERRVVVEAGAAEREQRLEARNEHLAERERALLGLLLCADRRRGRHEVPVVVLARGRRRDLRGVGELFAEERRERADHLARELRVRGRRVREVHDDAAQQRHGERACGVRLGREVRAQHAHHVQQRDLLRSDIVEHRRRDVGQRALHIRRDRRLHREWQAGGGRSVAPPSWTNRRRSGRRSRS